jgi:hypothetical protein
LWTPLYICLHRETSNWFKQIIGAPAFFPTVWGWIKRWFDPITTSKIFILSSHDLTATLEAFIDPANIPKKYGGQLDFKFGDEPILDPAMENLIQWEGERKDFPRGPMYWVNKGNENDGHDMEALAAGTEAGKDRREKICRISTTYPKPVTEVPPVMNGHAVKPEYLTAPTEVDLPSTLHSQLQSQPPLTQQEPLENGNEEGEGEGEGEKKAVVQEGKLIPASRPEPVSFVTASEGVETLNEKTENLSLNGNANGNRNPPRKTTSAKPSDPAITAANGEKVLNADQNHGLSNTTAPAVGGGVDELGRKSHEGELGQKVKETIKL